MELPKECGLNFPAAMVGCLVALQDLVQSLEDERPELPERPVVSNEVGSMGSIVVIWADDFRTIQLPESQRSVNMSSMKAPVRDERVTHLKQLNTILSDQIISLRQVVFREFMREEFDQR